MERFDIIIKNGTILTMDGLNSTIREGAVGIKGDVIVYIGPAGARPFQARKVIDARRGLVLPGLVNGHTHAAMSLFRGLADDLPLMEWLNDYIFPAESKIDESFVFAGTLLSCAEMIMTGTTTFCDMYLFEDAVARAAKTAGIRCLLGEVLYDFPSPNYGPMEKGLEYTERLIQKWKGDPLVSVAVEPHSLFTCGPKLLKAANRIALAHDVPVITHLAETLKEEAQIKGAYGMRPVQHLSALGLLGPHLIAVHCVHVDSGDLDEMAKRGVRIVSNPESNMKLASGIAPVPEMLARGLTVGIGTDGCASNNNLDLFSEIDTAAKLHKVQTMDCTVMDAVTVLRMATIEGARALGISELTGSLEVGKKADVIVVDTNKPHLTPMYNPFSHLVYAARGNDVSHSIVNGRLVMEERKLLSLDLEDILAQARQRAVQVNLWLKERRKGFGD